MIDTKDKAATPAELKIRVLSVRSKLPKNLRALLFERFPERNTAEGASKINNVLSGASSDEELTEYMELLALELAETAQAA